MPCHLQPLPDSIDLGRYLILLRFNFSNSDNTVNSTYPLAGMKTKWDQACHILNTDNKDLLSGIFPSFCLLSQSHNTSPCLRLFCGVFLPSLFPKSHFSLTISSPVLLHCLLKLVSSCFPALFPASWSLFLLTLLIHSPSYFLYFLIIYALHPTSPI